MPLYALVMEVMSHLSPPLRALISWTFATIWQSRPRIPQLGEVAVSLVWASS